MLTFTNLIRLSTCLSVLALAPLTASAQTADYAMHEWGLVNFEAGTSELVTSGFDVRNPPPVVPIQQRPDPVVRPAKPLIYLTPGPSFDPTTVVTARIDFPDGYLHEVYPLSSGYPQPVGPGITTYQWPPITFLESACDATGAPTTSDIECSSLGPDFVCEAAELTQYLRPVDTCLSLGGRSAPVLLWNAVATNWPAPAYVSTEAATSVSNTSYSAISGVFVRVGDAVQFAGTLNIAESYTASDTAPMLTTQIELVDAVYAELVNRGLTENEANDFIDAWRPDQLQFPPPWQSFGFFDAATIDARAPLTLMPEPSERVRVLAFATQ